MILILLPQQIFSQKVNIDLQNQTTLLDKEATIDKAKFVENEKRLRKEVLRLNEIIRKQDSVIQSQTKGNIDGLNSIKEKDSQIFSLTNHIISLGNKQLQFEEKRKPKPSSLWIQFGTNYFPETKSFMYDAGVTKMGKKLGHQASVGIFNGNFYTGYKLLINL